MDGQDWNCSLFREYDLIGHTWLPHKNFFESLTAVHMSAGGRHSLFFFDFEEPQPTYHLSPPAYATPFSKQACRALVPEADPRRTRLQPRPRTMQMVSLGPSLERIFHGRGGMSAGVHLLL